MNIEIAVFNITFFFLMFFLIYILGLVFKPSVQIQSQDMQQTGRKLHRGIEFQSYLAG